MPSNKSRRKVIKKPKPARSRKKSLSPSRKRISVLYDPVPLTGYENALVKDILSSKRSKKSSEFSLLFNSVLSMLTPSMRGLYYEDGAAVGKVLYNMYHTNKRYVLYGEGMPDLASFLEKAGFSRVSYRMFHDKINLTFNCGSRAFIGENIHVFESGIISGFLSASARRNVHVDEVNCSSNGSRHCTFVASANFLSNPKISGHALIGNFADSVKETMDYHKDARGNVFSEEYAVLSAITLLGNEYSEHMNNIAHHLGNEIGSRLDLKPNSRSSKRIERLYGILGLGSLNVKSQKPLRMEVLFNTLKAKKEFVDISIAFLNGLLKNMSMKGGSLKVSATSRKESYIVRVSESKN